MTALTELSLDAALAPLVRIADAFKKNDLEDVRDLSDPVFEGRGGNMLLSAGQALYASSAAKGHTDKETALQPLVEIARAWDANNLDDEARKFYGLHNEHRTLTPPEDIVLVATKGGTTLLTLKDAIDARAARNAYRHG